MVLRSEPEDEETSVDEVSDMQEETSCNESGRDAIIDPALPGQIKLNAYAN